MKSALSWGQNQNVESCAEKIMQYGYLCARKSTYFLFFFFSVYLSLTAFSYRFMYAASLLVPGVAMSHEKIT